MVNPLRQNNITSTNYLNIVLKGCASGRSGINSLVRVYRQEAVLAKQTHGLQREQPGGAQFIAHQRVARSHRTFQSHFERYGRGSWLRDETRNPL